ncbi:MAG: hypothetical protein QXL22_04875 [Candidatus Nezhaarchaeales archaeon]
MDLVDSTCTRCGRVFCVSRIEKCIEIVKKGLAKKGSAGVGSKDSFADYSS